MATDVLYFHGFASSPQSQKLLRLAEILGPGVVLHALDLNVPSFEQLSFEAMVQLGVREGRARPPRAIAGSSLGAMVALEVARRGIEAPLVLIAPAIGVGDRWTVRIGAADPVEVFHHGRNANARIHRAFYEEMCSVRADEEPPATAVSVVLGRADESVPFEIVRTRWEEWTASGRLVAGSRFTEIAGGDHGLVGWADVIAREIRARAGVFDAF
ncbi:MAG TPA: YqiA/YcfP family alpha/beta fold hydrolase [Thermoanaerobaculia bacterium]|nr:YqiA/YcfP family alpha/beta fold hydrolase [Thermoanaerobaculia bacterium]